MNPREVDFFYNKYKNSIGEITRAEQRLIKESYTYEKWLQVLKEKSALIRQLYASNIEMFDQIVKPIMEHPEQLTTPLADKFIFHIDYFLTEGYRDYGLTVPILDILIDFYEKRENTALLFDSLFFKGLAIMQHNHYDESEEYFNRAISLFNGLEDCPTPFHKYRLMCAYFLRLQSLVNGTLPTEKKLLEYYNTAIHYWCEVVPDDFLTPKKSIAIRSIIHSLTAAVTHSLLSANIPISQELFAIVKEEFEAQKERCGKDYAHPEYAVSCEVFVTYHKALLMSGFLSTEQYKNILLAKYDAEVQNRKSRFSYNFIDFISLFDDELPDTEFHQDSFLTSNRSFTFIHYLLTELLETDSENEYLKSRIYSLVYDYYSGFSYISGFNQIDLAIWKILNLFFRIYNDNEQLTELLRNIYVHRQIATAIHSSMVGRLSEVIAGYIHDSDPMFFPFPDKDTLTFFAKEAGFIHDIGKLTCSDVINLQSRKIMDEEFGIIKGHPAEGAALLSKSECFRRYHDIALGHHKFCDGTWGYPNTYDNTVSATKKITDLISICDSIDAATDHLGRNYANAKNLSQVLEELKEGAGKRYNAEIVAMILQNEDLQKAINHLILEERGMIQYELYRDYVMPVVHFTKEDERFVRPMNAEDVQALSPLLKYSPVSLSAVLGLCPDIRYVVTDARGNLYSFLMAEVQQLTMHIHLLFTPSEYRRSGYASLLLTKTLEIAKQNNVQKVYLKELTVAHSDKFMWRRGFDISYKFPGYMFLDLRTSPTLFITSSQTKPKKQGDFTGPCDLILDNEFGSLLKTYWPAKAKVLAITSNPDDEDMLQAFRNNMRDAYEEAGFEILNHEIDFGDRKLLHEDSFYFNNFDVILICGGHVPTQNRFFMEVDLASKLRDYHGIIIATSAGSMNLAEEVYALPEWEGEAKSPDYNRFLTGLGFTKHQIIPHYNYIKDITVDGLNPIIDIAAPDSANREFIVLCDGSYIFEAEGITQIHGPAYRLSNGILTPIP